MGWGELFNVIIRIMLAVFGYATQLEKNPAEAWAARLARQG